MKNKLEIMLRMQDEMNTIVHPQWREQGWPWYRAAYMEASEIIEHIGWKWWKKQEPDVNQIKLELVDIFHFFLSEKLEEPWTIEELAQNLSFELDHIDTERQFTAPDYYVVEEFMRQTLKGLISESYFVNMCGKFNLSFNELYKLYIGKNVLNRFRQANGYKEGAYQKIWNGKEDNEYLTLILQDLDSDLESFPDDVYTQLSNQYKLVHRGVQR